MNPAEAAVRKIDMWQQRHTVPAFVFAVIKKFGDDEGGKLVALLAYFAFLSIFPLLLAALGTLGLVLANHPSLERRLIDSAFSEFPVIGSQLHSQVGLDSLHHSTPALVVGLLGAIFGGRGLANAVQATLNTVWGVPKVDRPGLLPRQLRNLGLLGLLALGVTATAGTVVLAETARDLGIDGFALRLLAFVVSCALYSVLFWLAFRVGTASTVPGRSLVVGAVLSAVAWRSLLSAAEVIVAHYLRHAHTVAGVFGVVLGLLAWFALQATVTVYAIEADVVRTQHLWPRSIVQPPLTKADEHALELATEVEVRRPEQQVRTRFRRSATRAPAAD
ncbi:MAG TPA: YhjD/YihY/BrkB family envelope integrity protein [Jatrophihabitans sp.]|jgi:YihY family inner membrane protein|nr:YhjD/YihY/BrkB family envelope integrity protein [Jatrophihabitans sp.]